MPAGAGRKSRGGKVRSKAVAVLVAAGIVCGALEPRAQGAPELKTTEFGRGPTIVFVHGLGGARTVWMPTARKLLGNHRVVMVDLPGHGESGMPEPFSLEAAAQALGAMLAKQKAESTVVVAHGLGGLLALMAVHAQPDRIKGLIVIDGSARSNMQIPPQGMSMFNRMLDERYDDILRRMFLGFGRDTTQGIAIHAQAAKVPPANMKAYLRTLPTADASNALKNLKPAFLFVASSWRWPAGQTWEALAKTIGYESVDSTRTRRVADSGYWIMSDQPDSLAAVIADFTARTLSAKK
jgi:pimeloyl-ACP methyl ester carboxylesterase